MKTRKDKRVTLRWDRRMWAKVVRAAREEDVVVSEIVRRAVREYVETVELREAEQ